MDIGLQIKKFREQQKISQEELALKIFVSRQTISNWETNKSCPDVKSLISLSNIFNVSLDNFIKEDINLDLVLEQRRIEFWGEGQRFFDLLRNNKKVIREDYLSEVDVYKRQR